jgi:hypothetical protein
MPQLGSARSSHANGGVSRARARDFDRTIQRPLVPDKDRTVKRRRADLDRTVKRAIDVAKAFAVEEATRPGLGAGDVPLEIEIDLSDL